MISDHTLFDFSKWIPPVPGTVRTSPVTITDIMRLKRVNPGLMDVIFHYATSGSGIDFSSPSTDFEVKFVDPKFHPKSQEYALKLSLAGKQATGEEDIVVRAIYWDGSKETTEEISTYTVSSPESSELGLAAILPPGKAIANACPYYGPSDGSAPLRPYEYKEELVQGKNPKTGVTSLRWNIKHLQPNTHYAIRWTWDPTSQE